MAITQKIADSQAPENVVVSIINGIMQAYLMIISYVLIMTLTSITFYFVGRWKKNREMKIAFGFTSFICLAVCLYMAIYIIIHQ
jgi:hypothetical protein